MGIICFGTQKFDDNRQWQIPFGLFFIIPTIVACCIWFVPEVCFQFGPISTHADTFAVPTMATSQGA